MKRWIIPVAGLMIASAVAIPAFAQTAQPTPTTPDTTQQAQPAQPAQPGQPNAIGPRGGRLAGVGELLMCSTTNPADAVAQALGMSASDLRVALVSGKTVSQLASSKNVDLATIRSAVATQIEGELDQALTDGLLTQTQHDALTNAIKNAAQANTQLGIQVPEHNVVNREVAAAKALDMSCADLVKAEQGGQSVAQIAQGKGVDIQTVIDAVTSAYKDALAEDVKEGLISQAESDGQLSRLTIQIGQWVYNSRPTGAFGGFPGFGFGQRPGGFGFGGPNGPQGGFGFGGPNGQPGQGGPFGRRGQNGQKGGNGVNPMTPPSGFNTPGQGGQNGTAPATPTGTAST